MRSVIRAAVPFVVGVAAGAMVAGMTRASARQAAAGPDVNAFYQIGPDSQARDGVPKGDVRGPFVLPSQAYPGTQHTYWVYVPAQYDNARPASLMVFQDGQAFNDMTGQLRAPNVLDNLIYRREIPVMLAVFINPGRTPEQPEPNAQEWGDRTTNRPTEYNTLDDRYARVVVDELMPALAKDFTSRPTPTIAGSAAPAPAPSPRSPSPGSGPPASTRCSASSAASRTCAAATRTPIW